MDIRIKDDSTLEEYQHANLLLAGRTGVFKYLNLAMIFLFLLFAFQIMVYSYLAGMAAAGFLVCVIVLIMLFVVNFVQYFLFPRRVKKAYTQFTNLSGPQEYRLADGGVTYKDQNGESTIPWGKYVHWLEDDRVLVLYPTDFHIHLFPKRCLSPEQLVEIRQAITNAKIPARKTFRVGVMVSSALVLAVLLSISCLLLIRLTIFFLP